MIDAEMVMNAGLFILTAGFFLAGVGLLLMFCASILGEIL